MLKIYIQGKEIDLDNSTVVSLNYQATDFEKPSAVKNAYTKSITVSGTKRNNQIFKNIWKIDSQYNNFNPKERISAIICVGDTLVYSGYITLDSITNDSKKGITYSFTFYGNTGDFFYNLMYDENGDERSMDSLYFRFKDVDNNIYTKDYENNYTLIPMSTDYLGRIFDNFNNNIDYMPDITPIPLNQGIYQDFDNSKVMVNSNNMPDQWTYIVDWSGNTKDGYYLLDAGDRDLIEWETQSLRANRQQLAVRTKTILDAISNPENNGGYTVQWDSDITSTRWYSDSYIICNQMEFEESKDAGVRIPVTIDSSIDDLNQWKSTYIENDSGTTTFNTNTMLNPTLRFDILPIFEDKTRYNNFGGFPILKIDYRYSNRNVIGGIALKVEQLVNNSIVAKSDTYFYTNTDANINLNAYYLPIKALIGEEFTFITQEEQFVQIIEYPWLYTGDVHIKFDLELVKNNASQLRFSIGFFSIDAQFPAIISQQSRMSTIRLTYNELHPTTPFAEGFSSGVYEGIKDGEKTVNVTKNMLFAGFPTPYKFLTDFTKMFGLKYICDTTEKTIKIVKYNNYYKNKIVDLNVDKSQSIKVVPYLTTKKWNLWSLETPETYPSLLYSKKNNKLDYGALQLSTNVNFSIEKNEMLDDSSFTNNIPFQLNAQTFNRIAYGPSYYPVVTLLPSYTAISWDNEDNEIEEQKYGYSTQSPLMAVNDPVGPKIASFNKDNEFENVGLSLVFLDGIVDVSSQNIYLSDDNEVQNTVNGNYCYILTNSEYDINNKHIFKKVNALPNFVKTTDDTSWNFGVPTYKFTPESNEEQQDLTIYNHWWKKWTEDQYSMEAKKIECNVFLPNVNMNELFQQFYKFDDCLWILNKVTDWTVENNKPTKCEFIAVQDKNNYLT